MARLLVIDDDITETDDLIFANLFPDASFTWTSGIYIKRLLSDKLQIGLYADYNAADLNLDFTYIESITDNGPVYTSGRFGDTFNSFVFGGNIEVMLW